MGIKTKDQELIARQAAATTCDGWALLTFDLGAGGNMTYCSNGKRSHMIRALRELADHLEVQDGAPTDGNRS